MKNEKSVGQESHLLDDDEMVEKNATGEPIWCPNVDQCPRGGAEGPYHHFVERFAIKVAREMERRGEELDALAET